MPVSPLLGSAQLCHLGNSAEGSVGHSDPVQTAQVPITDGGLSKHGASMPGNITRP